MKAIPIFVNCFLFLLLNLSLSSGMCQQTPPASSNSPEYIYSNSVICDTLTYADKGDTLVVVGIVESTLGKSFKIKICATQRIKYVLKRRVISLNGKAYDYAPANQEELENVQQEGSYVMVIQENGNRYLGTILQINRDTLVLETQELGTLTLNNRTIKTIKPISASQFKSGVWLTSHGVNTRYYFGTNGYSLEKGTGYYQNTWVLFNQFNYGLTDHLSVGGGLIPLFLFGGTPTPIWGTLKYSLPLPSENFHFATGMLFGTVPADGSTGFGLIFGQATLGSNVSNVNFGMGFGFGGGTFAERPAFSLSTLLKTGRKAALVSENYLINVDEEYVGILSFGWRFYLRSVSIDGALIFPASGDIGFFAFPWLGLTVPFGE